MKELVTLRVEVRLAWWWSWLYVPALYVLVAMGGQPDWDKVGRVAARAVKFKLARVRPELQA